MPKAQVVVQQCILLNSIFYGTYTQLLLKGTPKIIHSGPLITLYNVQMKQFIHLKLLKEETSALSLSLTASAIISVVFLKEILRASDVLGKFY